MSVAFVLFDYMCSRLRRDAANMRAPIYSLSMPTTDVVVKPSAEKAKCVMHDGGEKKQRSAETDDA